MCELVAYIVENGLFFFFLTVISLLYLLFTSFNLYIAHFSNYNYLYSQNLDRSRSGFFFFLKLLPNNFRCNVTLYYSFFCFLY